MRFSIELKFLTTKSALPAETRYLILIQIERPPVSVTLCTPGSRRINFIRMGQHARSSIVVVVARWAGCALCGLTREW